MIDYATFQRIQHLHRVEQLTVAQIALAIALDARTVRRWLDEPRFRPRLAVPAAAFLSPWSPSLPAMPAPAFAAWPRRVPWSRFASDASRSPSRRPGACIPSGCRRILRRAGGPCGGSSRRPLEIEHLERLSVPVRGGARVQALGLGRVTVSAFSFTSHQYAAASSSSQALLSSRSRPVHHTSRKRRASVSLDGDKTWVRICSRCGRGQLIAHPRLPSERAVATSSFIRAVSTAPGTSVSPTTKAGVPRMPSWRPSARTSPR